MRKKRTIQLILTLFLVATVVDTVCGAFLTYKSYIEIHGTIHPLGDVEIDRKQMVP